MNIFGIGTDIVETARIVSSIDRFGEKFLDRVFTPAEQEYCRSMKHPERHYAARFAAKEAIAKAFGTGIGEEVDWIDLEILRRDNGEPYVTIRGKGEEFAGKNRISSIRVSLSHADHYATANALALCGEAAEE